MKKVLRLLLLFVLFIPLMVNADMAAPSIDPYDVEVVKDGGIDYYDYRGVTSGTPKGHLDKGTVFEAQYQLTIEKEHYLYSYYKNQGIYVKANEVFAKGELKTDDNAVFGGEVEIPFKVDKEVIVRKGPSDAFEEVGKLKKGEYTYSYYISDQPFFYVDVKGIKGWVYGEQEGLAFSKANWYVLKEIYSSCATIPADTELKDVWADYSLMNLSIKYDGCETTVRNNYKNLLKLYDAKKIYKVTKELDVVKDMNNTGSADNTLNKGVEFKVLANSVYSNRYNYYLIEYKNEKMFARIGSSGLIGDYAEYVKDEEVKTKVHHDDDDDEDEEDSNTVIIICVVVGVALALAALTTIILINKKKKEK